MQGNRRSAAKMRRGEEVKDARKQGSKGAKNCRIEKKWRSEKAKK